MEGRVDNSPPPEPVPSLSASGLASLVTGLGFIGFITIGGLTQLASVPFGLWWCELFLFFGIPYVALRLAGKQAFKSTGLTRPWVASCAFGFALGFANFFAAVAPIQFISQKLAPYVLSKSFIDAYDATKIFQGKNTVELLAIISGVCIAAPIAEEYFFRGVLQRGWGSVMQPVGAIVLTGAVFSAFHMDPIGFAARWELGILFGLLAWRSGSLWPGVFAHLANNLTSTCLYFALKDEAQDPTDDVTAIFAIAGIGGVLLLTVLLTSRRFPQTLQSPSPATDTAAPPATPIVPLQWFFTSLAAIALLLLFDFRGSVVRGIEMSTPVKEPNETLKSLREATLRGDESFGAYFKARRETPDSGSN